MPIYEYKCKDCEARFEYLARTSDKKKVICPGCGGKKTEKIPSTFSSSGTDKGDGCSSCSSCPGCGS